MDADSATRKSSLGSSSHVRFPDSQVTPDHSGEIAVEVSDNGSTAEANLGFLQIGRRYEVSLKLPVFLGEKITMGEFNPNVRLVQAHHLADRHGHTLKIELTTSQERQFNEVLELIGGDCKIFRLVLSGRVLGKGKGLLNNVFHFRNNDVGIFHFPYLKSCIIEG